MTELYLRSPDLLSYSVAKSSQAVRAHVSRILPTMGSSEELAETLKADGTFGIIEKAFTSQAEGSHSFGKDHAQLVDKKISFTHYFNPAYPQRLRKIFSPPIGIFSKGLLPGMQPSIAIVGARSASTTACGLARKWANELSEYGICIVSGLALGIDGSAHLGALNSKKLGATAAVLAHGLDSVYPSSHQRLAEEILTSGGSLISEYPIGISPLKHHFLERNRIIAGLADIVILVQAAERSGAIVTVRYANECGKEIGVVPWDPNESRGVGCLKMLRDGATLIRSVDDILEMIPELESLRTDKAAAKSFHPIVDLLRKEGPLTVDYVRENLGEILVNELTLIELELDSLILRSSDNVISAL